MQAGIFQNHWMSLPAEKAPVYADKQEIEMIFYFRLLSGLQRQNLIKYAEELSRADEACGKSAGERP